MWGMQVAHGVAENKFVTPSSHTNISMSVFEPTVVKSIIKSSGMVSKGERDKWDKKWEEGVSCTFLARVAC
jgi:hypothetical protein